MTANFSAFIWPSPDGGPSLRTRTESRRDARASLPGSVERDGVSEIVGIIANPNDPKSLVPADSVTDDPALRRYPAAAR